MPIKIDLTLPRQWDACSTEHLELIASVIREQVERQDRYHPFSMHDVKIALFFALAGIEIVEGPNPCIPVEDQYYTCRLARHRYQWFSFWNKESTFSLYLWQINYWLSPKEAKTNTKTKTSVPQSAEINKITAGAGMLDWLDNENGVFLTRFPYPEIRRRKHSKISLSTFYPSAKVGEGWGGTIFHGPLADLESFSWAQYRLASEAMQSYTQLSNSLIKMQQMGTFSPEQMIKQTKNVDLARAMFLATIFITKTKFVDTNTGIIKKDFHYESNQISDNAQYFRNYPDTQWQVILFWWTGIMHSLSKRYPHVFKVQRVDKKHQGKSPLDIYSATIATMQKYVGLDENQCNNQSYSLVLEQLERMSKENEEMEKIRRKH